MAKNETSLYDTRKILEQMRSEYMNSLEQQEAPDVGEVLQLLTFVISGEAYAMETLYAKEVLKIPRIIRVPKTPPFVLGVINLRGKITSVVDIRKLIGLSGDELGERARVVIVETPKLSTAIVVEEIREIVTVPKSEINPVAKALAKKDYIAGQVEMDGELVVILDMEKLSESKEMQV